MACVQDGSWSMVDLLYLMLRSKSDEEESINCCINLESSPCHLVQNQMRYVLSHQFSQTTTLFFMFQFDTVKDKPYQLSIITYALILAGSAQADGFLVELEKHATTEGQCDQ